MNSRTFLQCRKGTVEIIMVFLGMDLHIKSECTFVFVTGCALSDSHHVSTKSDWIDNTEFATQGGRRLGGKKQSSFTCLCYTSVSGYSGESLQP